MDSIIARPTNNVLVMVEEASGCWAIEFRADTIAFASPRAGPILPIAIVNPAVIIDAAPIVVILSIRLSSYFGFVVIF
jgi:hypothetical protein